MKPIYEIIGPDNKVHYRRPEGHPDLAEAVATEGYSVRKISTVPSYFQKAHDEYMSYQNRQPARWEGGRGWMPNPNYQP